MYFVRHLEKLSMFKLPKASVVDEWMSEWIGGMILNKGTSKHSEKNLSQCHFVHHKSRTDCPGFESQTCLAHFIRVCTQEISFRFVCEKPLLTASYLSLRMELLDSHSTDLYEILHFSIVWRSFEKIQVSLKPDKNNGYFTRTPMYISDNISLNSS
jgi:hypothetical protein